MKYQDRPLGAHDVFERPIDAVLVRQTKLGNGLAHLRAESIDVDRWAERLCQGGHAQQNRHE